MKFELINILLIGTLGAVNLKELDDSTALCNKIDIRELNIDKAHKLFTKERLSCEELTKCYLHRIKKFNSHLNVILETNPRALDYAREKDAQMKEHGLVDSLHCALMVVSDNIGTDDKMQTTSGSTALHGLKPEMESSVVTQLKSAGTIVLGKSNLSELSGFLSMAVPEGWSTRGNQTMNPYVSSESPRGPSSGSAVAVTMNMCSFALGTEAGGSIHYPSMVNGVLGLKTTTGTLSMDGIIPTVPSLDAVGIISRNTEDTSRVYEVLHTKETKKSDGSSITYKPNGNVNVGIIRSLFNEKSEISKAELGKSLNKLIQTGIEEFDVSFEYKHIDLNQELTIATHEFKYNFELYLKKAKKSNKNNNNINDLNDLIKHYKNELKFSSKDIKYLELAAKTKPLKSSPKYIKAYEILSESRKAIRELIDKDNLHVIAVPADSLVSLTISALAGLPSITIPSGTDNDLPISLALFAPRKSERLLLYLASKIESYSKDARPKPQFLK